MNESLWELQRRQMLIQSLAIQNDLGANVPNPFAAPDIKDQRNSTRLLDILGMLEQERDYLRLRLRETQEAYKLQRSDLLKVAQERDELSEAPWNAGRISVDRDDWEEKVNRFRNRTVGYLIGITFVSGLVIGFLVRPPAPFPVAPIGGIGQVLRTDCGSATGVSWARLGTDDIPTISGIK